MHSNVIAEKRYHSVIGRLWDRGGTQEVQVEMGLMRFDFSPPCLGLLLAKTLIELYAESEDEEVCWDQCEEIVTSIQEVFDRGLTRPR